ncbi:MAG TPA: hypothetical protein VHB21_11965 [Minicystis sp.]|nr:hypothetical protein [Minicystis sp.]
MRRAWPLCVLLFAGSIEGCQCVSGLGDLSGVGGSGGGASGSATSSQAASSTSTGGGSSTTTTGSATSSTGAGGGGGSGCGGGSAVSCSAPGQPPCPGTCAQGTCSVTCPGDGPCSSPNGVDCGPPDQVGYACDIACTSPGSCMNKTINCPTGSSPCTVHCSGTGACIGATIKCGDGPCTVICDQMGCASDQTHLYCGHGPCTVTCGMGSMSGSMPPKLENAGTSCAFVESCMP